MPSSFTSYNRLTKQATGENTNTWGLILNAVLDLIDFAMDGTVALTATTTLTSANGSTDQARARALNYTGASAGIITIPALSHIYMVRAATANCTITNGASSVTVLAGSSAVVMTDGTTVWIVQNYDFNSQRLTRVATPTANTDAANKKYVDDTAFGSITNLPGLSGNRGRFLQVNDAEASAQWDVGWEVKTANFNAVPGGRYIVDTTAGPVTATLWGSPITGDVAFFRDGGNTLASTGWKANNLTIGRNGKTIMGLSADLVCDVRGALFGLSYQTSDFRLV